MKASKAERFLLLSFVGCSSRSNVAVRGGGNGVGQQLVKGSTVESCRFNRSFFFPKPRRFAAGFRRFINTVKSISYQFFFYTEVLSEDEEIELEIGLPTDVKHLTHIGLDGTTATMQPSEFMSFPSVSLRQFELAMAAQTHATPSAPPPCPPPSAVSLLQRN